MIILRHNLITDFWGPMFWYSIHSMAFTYKSEKKDYYIEWFKILPKILPCGGCRKHCLKAYNDGYKPTGRDFVNSNTLFKYTYKLHSYVNKCLNKANPSYKDVYDFYSKNIMKKDIFYGPTFWHMIHSVAYSYHHIPSDKDIEIFRKWFELSLKYIYPNTKCLEKYKINKRYFKNRSSLIKFSYDTHSFVNSCIGKRNPSFNTFSNFYRSKTVDFLMGKPKYIGTYNGIDIKFKE